MEAILLALSFACLNVFRGRAKDFHVPTGGRIIACTLMGIVAAFASANVVIGLAVALGTFLWALNGWGKYFAAIHGRPSPANKVEVRWIDWTVDHLLPRKPRNPGWHVHYYKARGTLGMALRGLHLYPLFIALAWLQSDTLPLFVGLFAVLQGPCYYLAGLPKEHKWSVAMAEAYFGVVIGMMIVTCI